MAASSNRLTLWRRLFPNDPFLLPEEEARVREAIRAAELSNRGEVQVHLEGRCRQAPLTRAEALFHRLGLDQTAAGTSVLLYVAVHSRKAAVFAGPGLLDASEPTFWTDVIEQVAAGFASGDRVGSLVQALELIGELLRTCAPGEDIAGNELPNEVSTS